MDLENTIDNYIKCNNIEDTLFWPLFYDFSTLSYRNLKLGLCPLIKLYKL